jgi:hypothetical protein
MKHIRPLLAGDGQPFSAFCAASFQDEPTVLRAHTDEKTVRPLPSAGVGLKRAFTFHGILLVENEPSMLANAFGECQLTAGCVTVGVLSRSAVRSGIRSMLFGLPPKFSTPVEKTVENRQIWASYRQKRRVSRHNHAESVKT